VDVGVGDDVDGVAAVVDGQRRRQAEELGAGSAASPAKSLASSGLSQPCASSARRSARARARSCSALKLASS
jgi:hypothetical protein